MRLAPRLAVPFMLLALVAGCGGSQVAFEEAPGDPVELKVPGDASALAPAAATATATPDATEEPASEQSASTAPAAEPTAEAPAQEQPQASEEGGTAAPDDGGQGQTPDSDASEEFCANNPGAC